MSNLAIDHPHGNIHNQCEHCWYNENMFIVTDSDGYTSPAGCATPVRPYPKLDLLTAFRCCTCGLPTWAGITRIGDAALLEHCPDNQPQTKDIP